MVDFRIKTGLLALLFYIMIGCSECRELDDYITHYDTLHYDAQELHQSHLRQRRSTDGSHLQMEIKAFDRVFPINIRSDSAGFAQGHVLEFNGKTVQPDLSFLYSGHVSGLPGSKVSGAIIGGIFQGTISIPSEQEVYHIEKSNRFFGNKPGFHSVVYKESHMNLDPFRERRTRERREAGETGSCANDQSGIKSWMESVVNSEFKETNRAKRSELKYSDSDAYLHNKYKADYNKRDTRSSRKKRANVGGTTGKDTCYMSMTSDKAMFDRYKSLSSGNEEVAKDEILAFFSSHIKAINDIYGTTVFEDLSGTNNYQGVQFTVQKTKVMTAADCTATNPLQSFCQPNVDVSNFLNMNSLIDHDEFCLAYVFTYRDFSQGTLGLAWVGSDKNSAGGVCERNKRFVEDNGQVYKSLNTGIVTTINYGKAVPSKVSQLTFAHEVGHNFGSPHDTSGECAPYGTSLPGANEGNYIMFASATMGDKPHNSKFSKCSKDSIYKVLDALIKGQNGKINCFQKSGPYCGNGIVEDGETCDCGFADDCIDQCCNAKDSMPNNPEMECKLKNVDCSPTQGPCCSTSCTFIAVGDDKVCRYKKDCAGSAVCNGTSAYCPASQKELDGAFCLNFGFTCKGGECAGSLCDHFNWTECFTTGASETKEEQMTLCKLGCRQNNSDTGECILSDDKNIASYPEYQQMIVDVTAGRQDDPTQATLGVQLAPGSPCNNFQGYCDVFYRCRGVNADGPLSRLKNLIFNPETLKDIQDWIVEYWWAVLLMAIGLVLAMGLFIKFCAVHTPSSNPKAKPARKLSETMTLRRRRNQNRQLPPEPQQVRYPQYQKGYPGDSRGSGRPERGYNEPERSNRNSREKEYYQGRNPQGPPPPYPGSSNNSSHQGPPHGHGKKGKGRKGRDMEMGRV